MPQLVLRHAGERPDAVALRQKRNGRWVELTWRDYADRAVACAAGMLALGLDGPRHVAIFAEGRIEWVIAQMAVGLAGGVAIGCYPTSSPEELRHALGHGDTQLVVCENAAFLERVEAVRADLPGLRHIVVMDPVAASGDEVIAFGRLEQIGFVALSRTPDLLDRLIWDQALEAVALMVHTSGSTGQPKGALLTFGNMKAAAEGFAPRLELGPESVILSYLPLCHIAEQAMTNMGPLFAGSTVCFGGGLPTVLDDLRTVRPTYFSGVPRVWQKVREDIERQFETQGRSREFHAGIQAGPSEALAFEARAMVGLDRATVVTSGAAPLDADTSSFLQALGFPLLELYGMTEACSVMTMQRRGAAIPGCVGEPVGAVELKLADDGEILVRGANVFAGYYKDESATRAAFTGGWLRTGDIGTFEQGQLRIVDRKKDLMITDGGKNIAPAEIESLMRSSDLIQECVLVADRRKYVAALIQPSTEGFGAGPDAYGRLVHDPVVQRRIVEEIQRLNASLARVAQIKRICLLEEPLSRAEGDLTPTLKLRRFKVHQRHEPLIDSLYAGEIGLDVHPGADAYARLHSPSPA